MSSQGALIHLTANGQFHRIEPTGKLLYDMTGEILGTQDFIPENVDSRFILIYPHEVRDHLPLTIPTQFLERLGAPIEMYNPESVIIGRLHSRDGILDTEFLFSAEEFGHLEALFNKVASPSNIASAFESILDDFSVLLSESEEDDDDDDDADSSSSSGDYSDDIIEIDDEEDSSASYHNESSSYSNDDIIDEEEDDDNDEPPKKKPRLY